MSWNWESVVIHSGSVLTCGLLLALSARRISNSGVRFWFAWSIAGTAIYVALLPVFLAPGLSVGVRHLLSKMIFLSALLTFFSPIPFAAFFCNLKDELNSLKFRIYVGTAVVLGFSILFGLVSAGVRLSGVEPRPIYGPAYMVYLVFAAATVLYMIAIYSKGYATSTDNQFRYQIRLIGLGSLGTFISVFAVNAVVPSVTGTSAYTPFAALCLVFYWAGAAWLLISGEAAYASYALRRIRNLEIVKAPGGGRALGSMLDDLHFFLGENPTESVRHVRFGSENTLFVTNRNPTHPVQLSPKPRGAVSRQADLLRKLGDCRRENFRLVQSFLRVRNQPVLNRPRVEPVQIPGVQPRLRFKEVLSQARSLRKEFGMRAVREFVQTFHNNRR